VTTAASQALPDLRIKNNLEQIKTDILKEIEK
jgi:hypothetical protein